MSGPDFVYSRCPMKHHVRTQAWLPLCRRRLGAIREGRQERHLRRLRYFTFCAVEAVDVLMLDVARVIRPSNNGQFDTVFFFTRSDESVGETRNNIPGAIGFPGSFVDIVLTPDDGEDINTALAALESPLELENIAQTRERMLKLGIRRDYRRSFPFDVINLDLEGYLFRPTEKIPGDLVRALRKVFEWQQKPLVIPDRPDEYLDGFGLMFTTRLGPHELSGEFLNMLRESLEQNLAGDAELQPRLVARTGVGHIGTLLDQDFEAFFKLSAPKIILQLLMATDWYVDPAHGIAIYEFQRTPEGVEPYKMLHVVMDVKRHNPPVHERAPGQASPSAAQAYPLVVRQLFERPETVITMENIDRAAMEADLDRIEARRRKYAAEI